MTDVPVGAQWVPEDSTPVIVPAEVLPEFHRDGSPSLADYVAGLLVEFDLASGDQRKAVKAELDRVSGVRTAVTAAAVKAGETR